MQPSEIMCKMRPGGFFFALSVCQFVWWWYCFFYAGQGKIQNLPTHAHSIFNMNLATDIDFRHTDTQINKQNVHIAAFFINGFKTCNCWCAIAPSLADDDDNLTN